ncbi:hypothetical protein C8Q79DRAFT_974444 [Trametes meyenii]|nr:hypothetical protein C8Q79DRAFT_974444 [Trametes meyenii]
MSATYVFRSSRSAGHQDRSLERTTTVPDRIHFQSFGRVAVASASTQTPRLSWSCQTLAVEALTSRRHVQTFNFSTTLSICGHPPTRYINADSLRARNLAFPPAFRYCKTTGVTPLGGNQPSPETTQLSVNITSAPRPRLSFNVIRARSKNPARPGNSAIPSVLGSDIDCGTPIMVRSSMTLHFNLARWRSLERVCRHYLVLLWSNHSPSRCRRSPQTSRPSSIWLVVRVNCGGTVD